MHEIRLVEDKDLNGLSAIFVESFNSISPEKPWDFDHALAYLSYWYKKQPDMFWGAFQDEVPIGAMAVNIKPWRTEVRCSDGVVFIGTQYQRNGIAKELFKKVVSEAVEKYNAKGFEAVTFAQKDFPLSWYNKIGIGEDTNVVFIKGTCSDILKNLQ